MKLFLPRTPRFSAARLLSALAMLAMLLSVAQASRADVTSTTDPHAGAPVYVLSLKGAIGPATASFVVRGMAHAQSGGAQLIVLEMDTPGGLDLSMREIIQAILTSPVPVASFVYPGGARAASAGTYILYASHIAAMAPGTNVGAASPVQIGLGGARPEGAPATPSASQPASAPRSADTMERKQMHDASAYIRGLAQLRGRNVDWAERAVREAVSLSANEAMAQKVIDLVAPDLPALLRAVDGRTVTVAGTPRVLHTAGAPLVTIEPDWRSHFLAVITDPSVALILLMIGVYGLIFEFSTPGMVLPGVAGGICLLLALFALQMLPVNYAGLALIALGVGCLTAEAYLPTFGTLGIGGIVAFSIGALMLIDTDVPGFGIPIGLIGTLAGAAALLSFGMSVILLRTRRRTVVSGDRNMIGKIAVVLDNEVDGHWAEVNGERWRVNSARPLVRGQHVRVVGRHGLVLDVEPGEAIHQQ